MKAPGRDILLATLHSPGRILLFNIDTYQLYIEDQGGAWFNFTRCAIAISQSAGNKKAGLFAGYHQLQAFSPSGYHPV